MSAAEQMALDATEVGALRVELPTSRKVTLYVPCYNVAPFLTECLNGVFGQTYPLDEVLVVDDASTDDTAAIARRYGVRLITHAQNSGLAAARNTAFRNASNEFVAALDADCAPHPCWLANCMAAFDDERVAGVTGKRIERYTSGLGNAWREAHMSLDLGPKRLTNPEFIAAGQTVYRRSVIKEASMFNPKFRRAYEDVDMSQRITKLGHRLVYEPSAVLEHIRTDTVLSALETMWRYQYHAHASPSTLAGCLYNCLANVSCASRFATADARHFRWRLLAIDAFYAFYPLFLDFARGYPT